MAKWLRYNYRIVVEDKELHEDENGNVTSNPVEREVISPVMVRDDEAGRALAAKEAYGDIEYFDDGIEEVHTPSTEERFEALEAAVTMLCMPDISEV